MCCKIYDTGPTALLPFRRKSYAGFLRSEKIHQFRPGLNLRTSDPVVSMITNTENYMPSGVLQFMLWLWEWTSDPVVSMITKAENYMQSGVLQFMLWLWERTACRKNIDLQLYLETNLNILFPGKRHATYPIAFQITNILTKDFEWQVLLEKEMRCCHIYWLSLHMSN